MPSGLKLGAPGLYTVPEEPIRALTGARMDVAAFVGVAPRGPARPPRFDAFWAQQPCDESRPQFPRSVPVPVESFDAYRRLYGGFEGPGLLPYAVASFFEQGGRRAYIVRVVHHYEKEQGGVLVPDDAKNAARVATAKLGSLTTAAPAAVPVVLRARDEGAWGNELSATLALATSPLTFSPFSATGSIPYSQTEIVVDLDEDLPDGSLVRFRMPLGSLEPLVLRTVTFTRKEWEPFRPLLRRVAVLDQALPETPIEAELVTGVLSIDDGDGRRETHGALGLSPLHPRWLARVLYEDSTLLHPTAEWLDRTLALSDPALPPMTTERFDGGGNDYPAIVPQDFFDELGWELGDDCPGSGVHALVAVPDLAQVVVPDLYSPQPLVPAAAVGDPPPVAGPEFGCCPPEEEAAAAETPATDEELTGLRLNPLLGDDLDKITGFQGQLADLAEALQSFIVLLDVPPGLNQRQILRWRQSFATAYAAAYHPWLKVSRPDDARDALIAVNPSAVAAGIIAARELALGIPHGPANVIAAGVVSVAERVPPARHDELHQSAVNVYLQARDGVELTAARTLSRDPLWRQLSVRRLVTMLRRVLETQMQWAVFEPHTPELRGDLRRLLSAYLRQLYRANAFRGATESEAFFVRCDDELNPPEWIEQGRLLAHVGVAPAEPLEFIVLRIARDGDGTLRVEG